METRSGCWRPHAFTHGGARRTKRSRQFALRSDMSLRVQAEGLNLFNHAQFEEPGTTLTDSNFGQITNTLNDGRTFQFTLGLSF